jgi:hypothetical protein
MKSKIIFIILILFFTSLQFFGQDINNNASANFNTSALSTASLPNSNNIQSCNPLPGMKSASEIIETLRLKLTCDANSYYDEAIVIFNNSDPSQGAVKLMSIYPTAPELWSVKNGQKYSISFLGDLDSTIKVPITVKAGLPGNYTIAASLLESFGANVEISLEDRETGAVTNFGIAPEYSFFVSEPSTIADRFYLHVIDSATVANKEVTAVQEKEEARNFKIYSSGGTIMISSLHQQNGKIAVFDLNGRKIASGLAGAGNTTQIDMHGNTGVYIVSVLTNKGKSNTKIIVR